VRCKKLISIENSSSDTINQDENKVWSTIDSDQYNEWGSQSKKISESEIYVNSRIWCVDCNENVVVLGCADGSLQFWDLYKGILKVCYSGIND
jgi:citrate lyase alpha subunit